MTEDKTLVGGRKEISLELSSKGPLCLQVFMVPGGTMQTTVGEKTSMI